MRTFNKIIIVCESLDSETPQLRKYAISTLGETSNASHAKS